MEATGVYWLALSSVAEAAGPRCPDGRWAPDAPSSGPQERHAGLPVGRDPARLMACCGRGLFRRRIFAVCRTICVCRGTCCGGGGACPAHAKGAGADEYQAARRISSPTGRAVARWCARSLAAERDPAALLELCDVRIRKARAERVLGIAARQRADEHRLRSGRRFRAGTITRRNVDYDHAVDCRSPRRDAGGRGPAAGRNSRPSAGPAPANTPQIDPAGPAQRHVHGKDATTLPATANIPSPAACWGGRHGSDQGADREALRVMDRARAGQRPERQRRAAAKRRRNRRRADLLRDAPAPWRAANTSPSAPITGGWPRAAAASSPTKPWAHKLAILFWARGRGQGHGITSKGARPPEARVLEQLRRLLRKLAKQFGQQPVPIRANPA